MRNIYPENKTYSLASYARTKTTISVLAALGLLLPTIAYAADDEKDAVEDPDIEVIDVKGIRSSVISAQQVKMGSDKIMDGISADDIGALPDRSVTETLQRVAGVSMDRYMSLGDPERFSVEGNGVIVRGLTQVRSEINGRNTFSADGGRVLSFADVPPELLKAVNVYKSPSADQIEGGISGTIDLVTRLPFQESGQRFAFSLTGNYGDIIDEVKPAYSVLYSNTWELNDEAKFGLLVDFAHSELSTRNDSIYVRDFHPRTGIAGHEDETVYLPRGADWRSLYFERERNGSYVALQFAPNQDHQFTFTYFGSDYDMTWSEDAIFVQNDPSGVLASEDSLYDSNNAFRKGRITQQGGFMPMGSDIRAAVQNAVTKDFALAYEYAGDHFAIDASLQRVDSTSEGLDSTVALEVTIPYLDVDLTGDLPVIMSDSAHLADPSNYYWAFIMDNQYDKTADMTAADVDVEYFLENDVIESVKFGVRYSSANSNNADTGYNWSPLAPAWLQGGITGGTENIYPDSSALSLNEFENFFGGEVTSPSNIFAPLRSFALDYPNSFNDLQSRFEYADWAGWAYWNQRNLNDQAWQNNQSEKTYSAYTMANFSLDNFSYPITGNFGIRYVRTDNTAHGSLTYPEVDLFGGSGTGAEPLEAEHNYDNWLPSLNIKVELSDELLLRFAASKAMARPDFNKLAASINLNASLKDECNSGDATACLPIGPEDYNLTLESSTNPYLDPMESTQFDVSLEWYYAEDSSAYVALFSKDISGYQVTLDSQVDFGGYTYNARWPISDAEADIKGLELSVNHFFHSLPAPFNGLGLQANYTYIDSSTDTQLSASPVDTDGSTYDTQPFAALSENSLNLIGIYEYGDISVRFAYNWRSEYLVSVGPNGYNGNRIDGGTYALPVYNAPAGYLDGSVSYRINDSLSVVLEANNILNTVTEIETKQNASGNYRSTFHANDVRYALSIRGNFEL
ncbi:TonB-dependent receptor [Alteromonas sp. 38]|uniref:TonB-dependent receptor n=1 Tax=unclassified Alteromonas TaxID=2614992 RepID=UPI0012F45D19|nr:MULTISPECIES: TonB-dependent receptor [unclassified Alteromonas]CAD5263387.1 TonB-dependent receptor [Alteromonas sp. 154]VXC19886.1 TonB-dependent receptor [Alteromonas sp. 38]